MLRTPQKWPSASVCIYPAWTACFLCIILQRLLWMWVPLNPLELISELACINSKAAPFFPLSQSGVEVTNQTGPLEQQRSHKEPTPQPPFPTDVDGHASTPRRFQCRLQCAPLKSLGFPWGPFSQLPGRHTRWVRLGPRRQMCLSGWGHLRHRGMSPIMGQTGPLITPANGFPWTMRPHILFWRWAIRQASQLDVMTTSTHVFQWLKHTTECTINNIKKQIV